jgi:P-type Cu+ transporter
MTCGNCARHVNDAINNLPGVRSGMVDLSLQQATVRWDPAAERDVPALLRAIDEAGYKGEVIESDAAPVPRWFSGWGLNLLLGIPITAFLMVGEWVFRLGMTPWFQWTAFALGAVVQVFAGWRFYQGAWAQLKVRSSNMDTLVALGSTTAFGYSAWALLTGHGGHVYFMESAAIITLISLGHWLETRMAAKASGALRKLLDLAPAMARRIEGGAEKLVPVAKVAPGDLLALRPGDKVPTDGNVVEGGCLADESMLTGESVPVEKSPGSPLFAGTINLDGKVVMRVSAVGEATALAHIVAAVQRAQGSRANIQRLGDRVSSVFVPIVVSIAVLAALWWGFMPQSAMRVHETLGAFLWPAHVPPGIAAAFIIAAAVLIIACPCAMGLATPTAIMAGSNAAAQKGILIRDGVALEKAGLVTAVLFDKTGTLTSGKPALEQTWFAPGTDPEEAKAAAAALARHSAHPISQAVAATSPNATISALPLSATIPGLPALPKSTDVHIRPRSADILVRHGLQTQHGDGQESLRPVQQDAPRTALGGADNSGWREIRGAGVEGRTAEGQFARLGSITWLADNGVDSRPGEKFLDEWTAQGATVVGLARGGELQALFAVRDTLKPGAAGVVETLKNQGLRVYMVTGDNTRTANAVAKQAGINPEHVFAQVRPEHKADFVKKLQAQGERVAFVGDGINDAPALEQADLGIAVSRASDIAREAADMILLKSEIEAVPESLGLAKATLRTIRQNFFWAFFYNSMGVPLAALGFLSPILCAAAMGISDMVVIGNALRLRRWKLRKP